MPDSRLIDVANEVEAELEAANERIQVLEEQVETLRTMLSNLEHSAQKLVETAAEVLSELQEHV